jgi:non-reducing end alpha-L-arabinofuranosidase
MTAHTHEPAKRHDKDEEEFRIGDKIALVVPIPNRWLLRLYPREVDSLNSRHLQENFMRIVYSSPIDWVLGDHRLQTMGLRSIRAYAVSVAVLGCSSAATPGSPQSGGGNVGVAGATGAATGGSQSIGGTVASGGANPTGGSVATNGGTMAGGAPPTGGSAPTGGVPPTGGSSSSTGGRIATGGAVATGGIPNTGGTKSGGAGGEPTTGGAAATGGTNSTGGRAATAGANATGGRTGTAGTSSTGGTTSAGSPSTSGPCDIYASTNTPCVAAHSTVRALLGAYTGNLYQVKKSDGTTKDISVLTAGGYADSAAQDTFCGTAACTISIIYDQSGKGNHLRKAPGGSAKSAGDDEADAKALSVNIGGHKVYGVHVVPGIGYRNNTTSGTAKGTQAETEYAVFDGKFYNGGCCFDYGNAETTNNDDGEGTMEAIYWGNCSGWGKGAGNGPWVMADIENGLWAGNVSPYSGSPSLNYSYVTAMIKGDSTNHWAIKAGNSQSGSLSKYFDGAYPAKGAWGGAYWPMRKQGAIILGIGGDNSNGAQGNFFEGVMTSGYSTDAADDAVQANIVAAGYGR